MRCKVCLETYRAPPSAMKENQICTNCQYKLKKKLKIEQEPILKRIQKEKFFQEDNKASSKIKRNKKISKIKKGINFYEHQNEEYKYIIHQEKNEIDKLIRKKTILLETINQLKLTDSSKGRIKKLYEIFRKKDDDSELELNKIKFLLDKKENEFSKIQSILKNFEIIHNKHLEIYHNNLEYIQKLKNNNYEIFLKSETHSPNKNRTCKGICTEFKAKKPKIGGRYDAGQGLCQICNIWIDHNGCHMKDGSAATEDSVGWFCNCCNYRVRQNPRNKVYKEKLRGRIKEKGVKKRKEKYTIIEQAAKIKAELNALKEKRIILNAQQSKPKKYMKEAEERPPKAVRRIRKTKEKVSKIKLEKEPVKVDTNKINKWISDALNLIRKRPRGILQSELGRLLSLSDIELIKVIPKLTRLEDIFVEDMIRNGIVVNKILKTNQIEEYRSETLSKEKKLRLEIKDIENKVPKRYEELEKQNQIKNSNQFKEQSKSEIGNLCMEVIRYKRKKIEQGFLKKVISEYIQLGSIKKVCEKNPWEKEERIRRHLPIPKRFPKELQDKAHHLISDPESSMTIVMYATDYFGWDGNINDESKVIDLAIKIKKGFQENNTLRLMLSGKRVG